MSEEKTLKLTRRRALGGLLTIGVGSAAVGAGTLAAFSDTETSSGNQVTAGTLDLASPSAGSFSASNLAPGDSTDAITVTSTYTGSIDATVDLEISLSEPDNEDHSGEYDTDVTASDFASQLTVDTAVVTRANNTTVDLTGGGSMNANELAGSYSDQFGTVTTDDEISVDLQFTLNNGAGNDYQGDGVSFDLTFTANQA